MTALSSNGIIEKYEERGGKYTIWPPPKKEIQATRI